MRLLTQRERGYFFGERSQLLNQSVTFERVRDWSAPVVVVYFYLTGAMKQAWTTAAVVAMGLATAAGKTGEFQQMVVRSSFELTVSSILRMYVCMCPYHTRVHNGGVHNKITLLQKFNSAMVPLARAFVRRLFAHQDKRHHLKTMLELLWRRTAVMVPKATMILVETTWRCWSNSTMPIQTTTGSCTRMCVPVQVPSAE